MNQFPSSGDLSSWAGVCPGNNRSAGKNKSSRTTGGNPWLRGTLTECAWAAAAKQNCFLKEKFWRDVSKSGGKKAPALIAVAHALLELAYQVLRTRQPFSDRKVPPLEGCTPAECGFSVWPNFWTCSYGCISRKIEAWLLLLLPMPRPRCANLRLS